VDYLKAISTAHSTYTEGAPLTTKLQLTMGRLVGGWVWFPSGPAGVLHLKAEIGGHQILPSTPGENYALNNVVVPFNLDYDITTFPLTLDLHTWNDSTVYAHNLAVCIFMNPLAVPEKKRTFWGMLRGSDD